MPSTEKRKPRQIETLARRSLVATRHLCAVWTIFENEKEAAEYLEAVNAARAKRK